MRWSGTRGLRVARREKGTATARLTLALLNYSRDAACVHVIESATADGEAWNSVCVERAAAAQAEAVRYKHTRSLSVSHTNTLLHRHRPGRRAATATPSCTSISSESCSSVLHQHQSQSPSLLLLSRRFLCQQQCTSCFALLSCCCAVHPVLPFLLPSSSF